MVRDCSTFFPDSWDLPLVNDGHCHTQSLPTRLLISYLPIIIDVILYIVNLCITTNVFPLPCKSSIVTPLIKKPGLDAKI